MVAMKKFENKTLLVLGSNVGSTDIVSYAKREGAHTIVVDYYPPERSEAKKIADESFLVSTADLDALDKIIEERGIDGVLAGISEFNLLRAMELSKRHNLPFYCTEKQWDSVESKELFRSLCRKNDVPCPKTWFTGKEIPDRAWRNFRYPLVVKPVDASTSAGVFICHNSKELRAHYKESINKSNKKTIIIEEFVAGNEFTAHYTISGGKAALACIDNRYPVAVHKDDVTTIPAARIYPSVFAEDYIRDVNDSVLRLCESLGMQDGILFVQGVHNPETNQFSIFEAGLRCAGEAPYRFLRKVNGTDFLNILVDHALLGKSDYDITSENLFLDGKCCGVVSFVAKYGIVGSINGLEETVKSLPDVVEYENRYPVGAKTPNGDTLRQLMIRFVMVCESREKMAEEIKILNENITVLNTDDEEMVIKFEPERLFSEF